MPNPDAEKINKIFLKCLFTDEEIVGGKPIVEPVMVEGLTR